MDTTTYKTIHITRTVKTGEFAGHERTLLKVAGSVEFVKSEEARIRAKHKDITVRLYEFKTLEEVR